MRTYLGIDIGAGSFNFIRGTREDINRKTYVTTEIPSEQDPSIGMQKIIEKASELAKGYEIDRIGVSAISGNRVYGGIIIRPPNMHRWEGVRISDQLRKVFGCDVRLENDVDTGLIGEYEFGHHDENMVWFYIGTGSSAAVINNGHIIRGLNSEHTEVGHITFYPKFDKSHKAEELYRDGIKCGCGQRNDIEAVVSGNGIRFAYGKAPEDIDDPMIWEEFGENLGRALHNVIHVYVPNLIVLAGGVAVGAGNKIIEPARRYLEERKRDKSLLVAMPELRLTKYGNDTTLLGALALAIND